jgi:hypothetical protein
MGRPPRNNPNDFDPYDETTLNLDGVPPPEEPFDPAKDDVLPELGDEEAPDRFERLSDMDLFEDDRS